jgi:WD40 repeat protein
MSSEAPAYGPKGGVIVPQPSAERGVAAIIDVSPDNQNLIYCNGSNVVIRSIEDPTRAMVYSDHNCEVKVAKFSPTGKYVASGDVKGIVRVWAYTNASYTLKKEVRALAGAIEDLSWDPESKRITAVGAGSQSAKVFSWDMGSNLGEILPLEKKALTCAMKPSRPYRMVFGGEDFTMGFYGGPPFRWTCNLKEHTNFVNCVRYAPDGSKFVSVSSDKTGLVYDGASAELIGRLDEGGMHKGSVYACSWSADSTKLVTSSADKSIKVWDMESYKCIATATVGGGAVGDMQSSVVWAGDRIISLSLDGTLNYFDAATLELQRRVLGHQEPASGVAFDASAGAAATVCRGGALFKWQVGAGGDGSDAASFEGVPLAGDAHTKRGTGIAAAGGEGISMGFDDCVKILSLATDKVLATIPLGKQPKGVAIAMDAPELKFAVTSAKIFIFKGEALAGEVDAPFTPTCIHASADGSVIAVGGKDKKVHFFAVDNSCNATPSGETEAAVGEASAVAISADGEYTAMGDSLREIVLYKTSDASKLISGRWKTHTTRISSMAWNPSSNLLASVSTDRRICIWSPDSMTALKTMDLAHNHPIVDVAWKDAVTLLTLSNDGVMKTWNIEL